MKKILFSLFFAAVIMLVSAPLCAAEDYSGYTEIDSKTDLINIQNSLDGKYYLSCDLYFTEEDFAPNGICYNSGKGWLPLGRSNVRPFTGVFDGCGHMISGIRISSDYVSSGLIGYNEGTIKNLSLVDSEFYISGENITACGSITGVNNGAIENCCSSCNLNYCENGLSPGYVGGISGISNGTIENCFYCGVLNALNSSADTYAGGIAGKLSGSLNCCYNAGCAAAPLFYGGIAGQNCDADILGCYYLNNSLRGVADGIDSALPLSIDEMSDSSSFSCFDFDSLWSFSEDDSYPLPVLSGMAFKTPGVVSESFSGTGVPWNPYKIKTKKQLLTIEDYPFSSFVLISDIVFTGADYEEGGLCYNDGEGFLPLFNGNNPFCGIFDGNGHFIDGLTFAGAFSGGFFDTNRGLIQKLFLDNCVASSAGEATFGFFTAENNGSVVLCGSRGEINASPENGTALCGGIAGLNNGLIKNTYYSGDIELSCGHEGIALCGGIAGLNNGTICCSYYFGNVLAEAVSQESLVCGITGDNQHGTVDACYYPDDLSQGAYGGNCTAFALPESGYKDQKSFSQLDFKDIWVLEPADSYPYPQLRSFAEIPVSLSLPVVFEEPVYTVRGTEPVFDLNLYAVYPDGTIREIPLTVPMLRGFDCSRTGTQILTPVWYGVEADKALTVIVEEKPVSYIELTKSPSKTDYVLNQPLSLSDGVLTVHFLDDTEEEYSLSAAEISYDSSKTGNVPVTASLFGKSVEFEINVRERKVTGIILTEPDSCICYSGHMPDLSGGSLKMMFESADGYFEIAPLSDFELEGFNNNTIGTQLVTVSCGTFSVSFSLEVIQTAVASVRMVSLPSVLEYKEKESFCPDGSEVELSYNSGEKTVVPLTMEMIEDFDSSKVGKQSVTVAVDGKKTSFEVTVVHAYEDTIVPSTCTERGYTLHECKVCGDCYRDSYAEALGHTPVPDSEKSPGCTEQGLSAGSHCLICGKVLKEQTPVKALGHDWDVGKILVSATVKSSGVMIHTCKRCKESETVEIPQLEYISPFIDVEKNSWYESAVKWAVLNGITFGISENTFSPSGICNRGQCVTFLYRAAGSPPVNDVCNPFRDVNTKDYYYNAVLWACSKGITVGTGNGYFSPGADCTRAQVVTFLWRMQKCPAGQIKNPFTDVSLDRYYGPAVLWAVEQKITTGVSGTLFYPGKTCSRAEIVTFLFRCFGQ